jgi:AraC family transcriptional regulator, positive regulator of tynA and feaB
VETYSTANAPRAARATYWNALYSSRLAHVTFEPADPSAFEAELHVGAIGPLGVAHVASKATSIERGPAHIRRGGERLFSFLLLVRGAGRFEHCGQSAELREGDITLCDNAAPHRLGIDCSTRMLVLRVPAELMRRHVPNPETWCGARLPADSMFASAAGNMLRDVYARLDGLPGEFGRTVAGSLLDVLATSMALRFDVPGSGTSVVARRIEAQRFVEAHLGDPDLAPPDVARALNISPRYLRMIFEGERESIACYILRRRLEECARQLASPLLQGRTITDIAFGNGFNSAAHFTRAFRERYGQTPSDYRRGAGGAR